MARYSLVVLKVPLNPEQTNKQLKHLLIELTQWAELVMWCRQDEDDEDAESGDDEAELMAELQKIKKERVAEIARKVCTLPTVTLHNITLEKF